MGNTRFYSVVAMTGALMLACIIPWSADARQQRSKPIILAQSLVNEAHSNHAEATEIGIVVVGAKGCSNIASTDSGDIGEKCERGDSDPIHTGKPYVEKEKDDFDVSLPLHDLSGKLVGAIGIELKAEPGKTQSDIVEQAKKIAGEIERKIPSKAALMKAG